MLATQVVARGQVVFVDAPEPQLRPGHILVKPLLVALCGSDIHRIYYARADRYPWPVGTSGHEVVARVEAVDGAAPDIQVGDIALTLSPVENAMSELYLAEAQDVLVLPACDKPLDHLLMAQQLGTAIYASKRLPNLVGLDVAVIGQGSAGLFLDFMCRRMGARRVIGLDIVEARVAAAAHFGASHSVNNAREDPVQAVADITGGKMADVVIEAAGDVDAINLVPHLVKTGGHMHFFGIPRAQTFPFDFDTFFRTYCTTTTLSGAGREAGRSSMRQALEMIANGEINMAPAITHHLPFEKAIEGYELAKTRGDGAIKIVIEMPGYRAY